MAKETIGMKNLRERFPHYRFEVGVALSNEEFNRVRKMGRIAHLPPQMAVEKTLGPAIIVREHGYFFGMVPGRVVTVAYRHDIMPNYTNQLYGSSPHGTYGQKNTLFRHSSHFPLKILQYGEDSESRFYLNPWTADTELRGELERVLTEDFRKAMGLEEVNIVESVNSNTFRIDSKTGKSVRRKEENE